MNENKRYSHKIYGHQQAIKYFTALYNNNGFDKLHHAWIFYGPRGCGKSTLANNLAKFVLHYGSTDVSITQDHGFIYPINSNITKKIENLSHPDFMLIDESRDIYNTDKTTGTINVDEIRNALKFSYMRPVESKYRVVLIDSIDAMTPNAANAALKFLEEPPANTIILMVLHSLGRTIKTILSRSSIIKLSKLSFNDFATIITKHNGLMEEDDLTLLYQLTYGSISTSNLIIEEKLLDILRNIMHGKCTPEDIIHFITKDKKMVEIYSEVALQAMYHNAKRQYKDNTNAMIDSLNQLDEIARLILINKALHIPLDAALRKIISSI